ncbi:MAG: FAD-binding oxidoreductase [Gemmatimonadota bacterium]
MTGGRPSAGPGIERIRDLLGPEGFQEPTLPTPGSDALPLPEATPGDRDAVQAIVRIAREEGLRLRPAGARVGLHLLPPWRSGPPQEPDLLVSLGAFQGVEDYEPADLTLRAGAGTTLETVDGIVAEHGQMLPLDPPGAGHVTAGGVVAMGTPGPLATGFGRPRDQVLGVEMVDGRGRHLALGGRVVKNVAGFDLVRLTTGSRGALGFILGASLRLFPRPSVDRTLYWGAGSPAEAARLGRRMAELPFTLPALEVVAGVGEGDLPGAAGGAGAAVIVRLLGSEPASKRLERELRNAAGEPAATLDGTASSAAALDRSKAEAAGAASFLLQVLPDRSEGALQLLVGALGAERLERLHFALRPATGTLRVWGEGLEAGDGPGMDLGALADAVEEFGGSVRLLAGEAPTGGEWPGVRPAPSVGRLHRELRLAFDPDGILPGAWREGWE